jgi:membrane-associated protein
MDWMQLLHAVLHLDRNLGAVIAQYGLAVYVILFMIVFVEIGILPLFFLPGDPLLFVCGAFCANGAMDLGVVMLVLFVATVAGSCLNHRIGQAVGERVFTRDYRWLDKAALRKTHVFYERHRGLTFLLSPFIAVIRTFAPFVGGVAGLSFARFFPFAAAGAALWVLVLVPAGYLFGNVPVVREHLSSLVLLGMALGVGSLVLGAIWRLIERRRGRR